MLVRIGGWRAAKEGRAAFDSGRVLSVAYEPPLLSGVVATSRGSVEARLRLAAKDVDIENLCSCREAREQGTICAHVLALGYAWINRGAAPKASPPDASESRESCARLESPTGAPLFAWREAGDAEPDAVWAEGSVILPPGLASGALPGGMQVHLEISINGASPLPAGEALKRLAGAQCAVTEEDARLLSFLQRRASQQAGSLFHVAPSDLDAFFDACAGHERITIARKTALCIEPASDLPIVRFAEHPGESIWPLELTAIEPAHPRGLKIGSWFLEGNVLRRHATLPPAYSSAFTRPITLDREQCARFLTSEAGALAGCAKIEPAGFLDRFRFRVATPVIHAAFDGSEAGLHAKLSAVYPGRDFPLTGLAGKPDETAYPDPEDPWSFFHRDIAAEDDARRDMAAAGFGPGRRDETLYVNSDRNAAGQFLASHLPRLRERWRVTLSERLEGFAARTVIVRPVVTFVPGQGGNWLDAEIHFPAGGRDTLSLADVRRMLDTGRTTRRFDDGRVLVVPEAGAAELAEVLADIDVRQDGSGRLRLGKQHAAFLAGSIRAMGGAAPDEWTPPQLREAPPLVLPDQLEKIMRPYQRQGAAWMSFLARNQLSGILADEMGLGKTLQTLAFIAAWRAAQAGPCAPCLVVCPTSLVSNWIAECERFTPGISTLAYHGPDRAARSEGLANAALVVTSYAILRRDIASLSSIEFGLVALDEAQHIKNRQSQNAQAAKALRASHRLVLTGTPIENSLGDLWSIFDFLMPRFLGRQDDFQQRYEIPITRSRDTAAMTRLQRRIGPFVLRRTKKEVAPELPPRLDETTWCELSGEQQAVYAALLDQSRRDVFELAGAKSSSARRRQTLFTALLRLRQACCHLALLPSDGERTWTEPSAKFDACLERIDEAVDGGHRVLVYSQFVRLLALMRSELDGRDIGYCYLDGQTADRAGEISKFRTGDAPLFLISLKAGGTGLNLTEADTVMLLDPWWNPAVEEQALARAHRIGQDKPVTNYRFITRGTVEERIQKLQQTKAELAANTLAGSGAAAGLSLDEMESLLR